jgi:hypothetical protein
MGTGPASARCQAGHDLPGIEQRSSAGAAAAHACLDDPVCLLATRFSVPPRARPARGADDRRENLVAHARVGTPRPGASAAPSTASLHKPSFVDQRDARGRRAPINTTICAPGARPSQAVTAPSETVAPVVTALPAMSIARTRPTERSTSPELLPGPTAGLRRRHPAGQEIRGYPE